MLPTVFDLAQWITVWQDSVLSGGNAEWVQPASATPGSGPGNLDLNQNSHVISVEDAVVVKAAQTTLTRWQDGWQPREVIVQKLYSPSNGATWARAYVPNGTYLFIREQATSGNPQTVRGMTLASGTDYFWAESTPSIGNAANQACISIPIFSLGGGHDLYERLCTDFTERPAAVLETS